MNRNTPFLVVIVLLMIFSSCRESKYINHTTYKDVNELINSSEFNGESPYLKAHLRDGGIYVFQSDWKIDQEEIKGEAICYNYKRDIVNEGLLTLPIDSVTLFETNRHLKSKERVILGRTLLIGLDVILGIVCIADPKICFGSCPTFYIEDSPNVHFSKAEGFSNAILPSMEYLDIDALSYEVKGGAPFEITMKNEALETHCVNRVDLYALPKAKGHHVVQTPKNKFYSCHDVIELNSAFDSSKEISESLMFEDYKDYFRESDPDNMKSKEEVILEFSNSQEVNHGLILSFRQSLMTTYIFYNGMGYMGNNIGEYMAKAEIEGERGNTIMSQLGGIDVYLWNSITNNWDSQGTYNETGPIAYNKQFIPFNKSSLEGDVKVKLVLNKGLWKIDYAALGCISEELEPEVLSPLKLESNVEYDHASLSTLTNDEYLFSMPGSEYYLSYEIPSEHPAYELFLGTKGYYLEWMRKEWLEDKDLLKVFQMQYRPENFLKKQALDYKEYEARGEVEFWNSKINSNEFTYYEK